MDYRITFIYRDSSIREVYASTEADVLHQIANEMRCTLPSKLHDNHLTIHVTNIALQE